MIVLSNHVKTIGMEMPKDAIVRINIAWVKSADEVRGIINGCPGHKIYLDYPTGRTKPPAPTMGLMAAIEICREFKDHIAYFAFSNAEDTNVIDMIRALVPANVKLAPKIETKVGVNNLHNILASAKTDLIMLDKEDLYIDCDVTPKIFNEHVDLVRRTCKLFNVTCLELAGVVFYGK